MGAIRFGLLVTCLTASIAASSGPSLATTTPRTCTPKGSHTILATKSTRIFWTSRHGGDPWVVYGCLRRRKRPVRLGSGEFDAASAPKAPSSYSTWSPYAAVETGPCDRYGETCTLAVRSVDLRNGRARVGDHLADHYGIAFEVSPIGTIGGIGAHAFSRGELIAYRVTARGLEVVDRGDDIDRASLRVVGTTMYWMRAGVAHSASLAD